MSLPHPATTTEMYLAAILAELRTQNQQQPKPTSGEVELQEPARPQRTGQGKGRQRGDS